MGSRRDRWWRKAKEEGYRSRAAYKLMWIDDKFHVIDEGGTVVDLGAAPGGWSQVAAERVGPDGRVVAIDRSGFGAMEGVERMRGDLTDDEDVARLLATAGGQVDVVVSDMSPDISGNYSTDVARSVHLAEVALEVAVRLLRPGGAFVVKVFEGDLTDDLFRKVEKLFDFAKRTVPEASRDESSEIYVVGKGFQGADAGPG